MALDLIIQISTDDYVSYVKSYYGVSVLIHGSEDFPQSADKTTVAQPGCDVTLAIIPSILMSESAIRDLTFDQRNCYFEDEVSYIFYE